MTVPMDIDFEHFFVHQGFGPAVHSTPVQPHVIERFRHRLPDQLLQYWAQHGWSGYGQGLLWVANPEEYEPALEAWIGDTPFMESDAHFVAARSAFGQLSLWGSKGGLCLDIRALWGMIFPTDDSRRVANGESDKLVRYFFSGLDKADLDQKDLHDRPLFDRALKRLGPLAPDEMYAFEPALAIGGKADLKHLRKVNCAEHLVMLAQLGERRIMRDIVKDAKAAGLM